MDKQRRGQTELLGALPPATDPAGFPGGLSRVGKKGFPVGRNQQALIALSNEHTHGHASREAWALQNTFANNEQFRTSILSEIEDVEESELKNYSVILKNRVLKEAAQLRKR